MDFLEKPIDHDKLIRAIEEAYTRQSAEETKDQERTEFDGMLQQLTPREREVMSLVVAGKHNREIADTLGISARTVEVHKARMMTKLGVV